MNNWKIASVVFGVVSLGLWGQHLLNTWYFNWWALLPPLSFDLLAIVILWKLGDGVWISDEEYKHFLKRDKVEKLNDLIEEQRHEREAGKA